jgi:hypothetical protein
MSLEHDVTTCTAVEIASAAVVDLLTWDTGDVIEETWDASEVIGVSLT